MATENMLVSANDTNWMQGVILTQSPNKWFSSSSEVIKIPRGCNEEYTTHSQKLVETLWGLKAHRTPKTGLVPIFLFLFNTVKAAPSESVSKHLSSRAQKALLLEVRTVNRKAVLSEGLTVCLYCWMLPQSMSMSLIHVTSMANPDHSPTLPDLPETN